MDFTVPIPPRYQSSLHSLATSDPRLVLLLLCVLAAALELRLHEGQPLLRIRSVDESSVQSKLRSKLYSKRYDEKVNNCKQRVQLGKNLIQAMGDPVYVFLTTVKYCLIQNLL